MGVMLSFIFFMCIISFTIKILPRLIGFTFSLFVGIIQIALALMLIPAIGIIFFMGFDFFMLLLLIIFLRVIR